jgi:hypothetical protein
MLLAVVLSAAFIGLFIATGWLADKVVRGHADDWTRRMAKRRKP